MFFLNPHRFNTKLWSRNHVKKEEHEKWKKVNQEFYDELGLKNNIIENPLIAKYADPEEWKTMTGHDPDEDDVLHVIRKNQGDKLIYNLFLNRTNINLRNEKRKANQQYTEKIIETKYKMGISLIDRFSFY